MIDNDVDNDLIVPYRIVSNNDDDLLDWLIPFPNDGLQ